MRATLRQTSLMTTAYHLQTKVQLEGFHETIHSSLQHYVAKHKNYQKYWDSLVWPLVCAYSTQIYSSLRETPFSHVSSHYLPGPTLLQIDNALPIERSVEICLQILQSWLEACNCTIRPKAGNTVLSAQKRFKQDKDCNIQKTNCCF